MWPIRYTIYSVVLTKVTVDRTAAARLLNFLENGNTIYCLYRRKRLVRKTKKPSTTISKSKLPWFADQYQKLSSTIDTEKLGKISHPRTWQKRIQTWTLLR